MSHVVNEFRDCSLEFDHERIRWVLKRNGRIVGTEFFVSRADAQLGLRRMGYDLDAADQVFIPAQAR